MSSVTFTEEWVEQRPGITVEQLAQAMGVTMQRAWQYVGRLEAGRVRAERFAAPVRWQP